LRRLHKSISSRKQTQILKEIGVSGLRRMGGQVYADPERKLHGTAGMEIYDLMSRSDPIIAGGLLIIESMVEQVPWFIRPGGTDEEDLQAAAHLESCIHDMSVSWNQTVTEILSMLRFGWSYMETTYKIRRGRHERKPQFRSQYNDGTIGWRRWAPRSQLTMWEWVFDDEGDHSLLGMNQRDPLTGEIYFVPLDKSLLFRFRTTDDNPEGESPLRGAYEPWLSKSIIEDLLKTGMERDLAGIPVLRAPKKVIEAKTAKEAEAKQDALDLVTGIRNDEEAGVLLSSECDEKGNPLWDLKLLTGGGQKQFNIVQVLNMYDQRIAGSFLVDIILLGAGRQGSYALAEVKNRVLTVTISSILDRICETINQHAVSRLAEMNLEIYEDRERLPELAHGKVENPNLEQLAEALQKLGFKAEWADPDGLIENYLRELADLPTERTASVEGDAVQKQSLEKAFLKVKERRLGRGVRPAVGRWRMV